MKYSFRNPGRSHQVTFGNWATTWLGAAENSAWIAEPSFFRFFVSISQGSDKMKEQSV